MPRHQLPRLTLAAVLGLAAACRDVPRSQRGQAGSGPGAAADAAVPTVDGMGAERLARALDRDSGLALGWFWLDAVAQPGTPADPARGHFEDPNNPGRIVALARTPWLTGAALGCADLGLTRGAAALAAGPLPTAAPAIVSARLTDAGAATALAATDRTPAPTLAVVLNGELLLLTTLGGPTAHQLPVTGTVPLPLAERLVARLNEHGHPAFARLAGCVAR